MRFALTFPIKLSLSDVALPPRPVEHMRWDVGALQAFAELVVNKKWLGHCPSRRDALSWAP